MNTIIFQTIRAVAIISIMFFAFVDSAFAAPMLTPVMALNVTGDQATLSGNVSNPYANTTVWFEIDNSTGSSTTAVAMQGIWHKGNFQWNLSGLTPGQTYTFRSAAMEGDTTVYSPTAAFTTIGPKAATPAVAVVSVAPVSSPSTVVDNQNTVVQEVAQPVAQKVVVKRAVVPTNNIQAVPAVSQDGFTNANSAAVIGTGSGFLPSTLLGWIALLAVILTAVFVGSMLYEASEKRKEEAEEKRKREAIEQARRDAETE